MTYTIEELNERVRKDPAGFVAECDEIYAKRVREAAEKIRDNMSKSPVVLLAGPSGAGKTTTAKNVETELERMGINTHTISMDNYFKTLDPRTCARTPEGDVDYESPDAMDMELLNEHFEMLANGEEIRVPYFMFTRQKRSSTQFTRFHLEKNEIAIFEGIHALNDTITNQNHNAFGLYISAESTAVFPDGRIFKPEWTRLVRRVVRDNKFRGADAKCTLSMWDNVMRGERLHITPFIGKARMTLDSALGYEIPVLKDIALGLFESFCADNRGYDRIEEIVPLLRRYESLDASLVPPTSLLCEFIGGGIYDY